MKTGLQVNAADYVLFDLAKITAVALLTLRIYRSVTQLGEHIDVQWGVNHSYSDAVRTDEAN